MYTEYIKNKVFELLMLAAASPVHGRHGRQKVSIPQCDLTQGSTLFACHDGDAISKVSCCVEPSWCSKNSDFDAIGSLPLTLPFKINVSENPTMVSLKSASFIVIMLLHEGLTHIQSQIKPVSL